ncbi:MAG: hypothetical protein ACRDPY_40255 [Streptosporangiaceae bacterium]
MNTTDWLIIATAAGPIVATLVAPGFISTVLKLAKARAQRVQHVPASGTDLYQNGVLLTETQFRELFAAYQPELDKLPRPADRTDWDMKRQFAAAQRLAVLTGTHPHAFPNFGDPDQAWEWYAANNPYAAAELPQIHGMPVSPDWLADPASLLADGAPRLT